MKPARILVIEKNDALRVEIARALEREGYTVIATCDILTGFGELYAMPPDLIITGNGFPEVKGEKPFSMVRQACYMPIIAIGSGEKAVEVLEGGADVYITKPASVIELVARVNCMVRRKRAPAIMLELEKEQ